MIARHTPLPARTGTALAPLRGAIASCLAATAPSRELDAAIGKSIFPALADLEELEPGIWRQQDGNRVRALNYTRTWSAAASLVPAGCWIEHDCLDVIVVSAEDRSRGTHDILPIALCLAALRARMRAADAGMAPANQSEEI